MLKLYATASGLCINMKKKKKKKKTKVVRTGSMKNSSARFCEHDQLHWENTDFTVLEVNFTNSLKDLNYCDKLNDIQKLFLNWSKRILTPLGKIKLLKV